MNDETTAMMRTLIQRLDRAWSRLEDTERELQSISNDLEEWVDHNGSAAEAQEVIQSLSSGKLSAGKAAWGGDI